MRLVSSILAVLVFFGLVGCQEEEMPPPFLSESSGTAGNQGGGVGSGGPGSVGGCDAIEDVDTSRACAEETVNLQARKPALYFLLDTSGSMAGTVTAGTDTKLEAAQEALSLVVRENGHRMFYGLATFPGPPQDIDDDTEIQDLTTRLGCEAGGELLAVREGDEKVCRNLPATGPAYREFVDTVRGLSAGGGTPLTPTLRAIDSSLLRAEGEIAVVLVTDGYPNCNQSATCSAEDCGLTGGTPWGVLCSEDYNCCDPDVAPEQYIFPGADCIDGSGSVEEIAALHSAGVNTYVIGVRGEDDFDDVMNELAVAGGRAREGERKYYDVETLDELTEVVRLIGNEVARNCGIELESRPRNANVLNVYFDGEVVPFDETDGWSFDGPDTILLQGDACSRLQKGEVSQIRFISGCETVVR